LTVAFGADFGFEILALVLDLALALAFTLRTGFLAAVRLAFALLLRAGVTFFFPLVTFFFALRFFAMNILLIVSPHSQSA
jgi:hypothetical protein